MTRWVGRLLIANVLVFFLQLGNPLIQLYLQYVPFRVVAAPWTLVTYTFLHGGFGHLFFNMLALWVFGPRVEARLGGGRFLLLYFPPPGPAPPARAGRRPAPPGVPRGRGPRGGGGPDGGRRARPRARWPGRADLPV